jgi:hypothetical protein
MCCINNEVKTKKDGLFKLLTQNDIRQLKIVSLEVNTLKLSQLHKHTEKPIIFICFEK